MSKRRRPRTPEPCPCGRPAPYSACCGRLHSGAAAAATAEELMRSRYSAFARGDAGYLLRSWHPDTRPAELDLDGGPTWRGLEILAVEDGGPLHTAGTVEFRARFVDNGRPGTLTELSRFVRSGGGWVYLDGRVE